MMMRKTMMCIRKTIADYQTVTVLKIFYPYTILRHFLTENLPVKAAVVASDRPALSRTINTYSAIPIDHGVLSTAR